jgi:hypothetical protein
MAAGLGFKNFTTGEVLTAADVNGYLMQGVLVFASEAARNAAITSPQEGQFAYTKDNNSLWYYTGSAWAASGATGDIEGVTAGTGISGGGTSGTVTITNDMATTITASGDIVVGTGSGTYDNLPIGTTGQILTADTTVSPYKVKWATPSTPSSGLTLVTKSSFSAVTSHSLDNCFSATYDFYEIKIGFTASTGSGADLSYKLRASGTDNSSNYAATFIYAFGATLGSNDNNGVGTDEFSCGAMGAATGQFTSVHSRICNPHKSQVTTMFSDNSYGSALVFNGSNVGYHNNTSSFDGITLIASSGTITGTIYVYGLAV